MPDESLATRRGRHRTRRTRGSALVPVVRVREAVAEDLEQLVRLRRALRREEGASASRLARRGVADETRRDLGDPDGPFLVAESAGRVIGMLRCQAHGPAADARVAIVTAVYVVPARRRQGVLRALVAAADGWCRARGLRDMRLRCAAGNATGLAAWSSLGFAADAIVMHRPVARGR